VDLGGLLATAVDNNEPTARRLGNAHPEPYDSIRTTIKALEPTSQYYFGNTGWRDLHAVLLLKDADILILTRTHHMQKYLHIKQNSTYNDTLLNRWHDKHTTAHLEGSVLIIHGDIEKHALVRAPFQR
jgi:hypothetical protein